MFSLDGTKIEVSKGDWGIFTITFTGDDTPVDGTTVRVSLKKNPNNDDTIWEKDLLVSDGTVTVVLRTEDTNISPGGYCWDVRILYNDGYVCTPIEPSQFVVGKVVGNVE